MATSNDIWVNVCAGETRVAVVEQGNVCEVQIQRGVNDTLVGNVYWARVSRVMPELQAAFVDFGAERHGFLALADLDPHQAKLNKPGVSGGVGIRDFLYQGQMLQVQITKDPVASKGARLTTQISFSCRYLVLTPNASGVGVSRKISDTQERSRLTTAVAAAAEKRGVDTTRQGFIIRTAARGVSADDIAADMAFITSLAAEVSERAAVATEITTTYIDLPLVLRLLRDLACTATDCIRVDCEDTFGELLNYCQEHMADFTHKLVLSDQPLAQASERRIDAAIEMGLSPEVVLPSGGRLIIEHTEAMTVVDVNSANALDGGKAQAVNFQLNTEAAIALAEQLRLRNIGGIVVVDFIDMTTDKQRQDLVALMRQHAVRDGAMGTISEVSKLGLVELTRKRSRSSLAQMLCIDCVPCRGLGFVKSPTTVCFDILRSIRAIRNSHIVVTACSDVIDCMTQEQAQSLSVLKTEQGNQVDFRCLPVASPELFEFAVF